MESELVKGFDFENNILLITINRPLSSVRIMERNTGWKDGKPYASAEFTYKKECEDDTVCFHSLPRVILKYKNRGGEIITSRLSLWKIRYDSRENPPNKVYQIQSVDYTEAARKWIWAFIVNDIKNFVFGPAKAPVYGFGRNRKQKFVMSFTINILTGQCQAIYEKLSKKRIT